LRQTTLNVLVGDAFLTAYLVGARQFGTSDLRVTAARIMGMESDHHTLARVLAPDVASQDGGPIEKLTGVQGVAEPVDPPNNNAYERTLCWTHIQQAVTALTPSADITAEAAGFDVSKSVSIRSCQSCPTRSEASFPSKAAKQCVKDDQPIAAKSRAAKFNRKTSKVHANAPSVARAALAFVLRYVAAPYGGPVAISSHQKIARRLTSNSTKGL
jgi:hypothetical protein